MTKHLPHIALATLTLLILAITPTVFVHHADGATYIINARRSITPDTVAPGDTFTVEVAIEAHGDMSAPALDEEVPSGWTVTPVDNAGFTFKSTTLQWILIGSWSPGDSATIVYDVTVPNAAFEKTYTLDGEISASNKGPLKVGGETDIAVIHPPAPTQLTANFTVTPPASSITVNQTVHFTDCSTSDTEIVNRTWLFHQGELAYGRNTTYQYHQAGSYPVILKITDSKGHTTQKTATITVKTIPDTNGETDNDVAGFQLGITLIAAALLLFTRKRRHQR